MTDQTPSSPAWSEHDRLKTLDRYRVMDTPAEADFDDIVRVAAQICGVPMALISLVDSERQWFKAALGLEAKQTPREIAFCAHAIQQEDVFTVEDATRDSRFQNNPLVTGNPSLRFYAGAQLQTPDGFPLGTLCVLDTEPRILTEDQAFALKALARQVIIQLELRRALADQKAADARQRLILESAIDYGIVTMDLDGVITSWSAGAHNLMQWTEAEMVGRTCDTFFTPEDNAEGRPQREMALALSQGRAADDRWHLRRNGTRLWVSGEMMPLRDEAGEPIGFLKIVRDRTEARRAEEHREMLGLELQHRVKNTLAMVQAIVSQTLRTTANVADARAIIADRLVTLGKAHDLLTAASWTTASLTEVAEAAILNSGVETRRVSLSGPPVQLASKAALGVALALHELNTNALKYGALSNETGVVALTWTISKDENGDALRLHWRERGGPPVEPPARRGFGSRLIQSALAKDIGGASTVEFAPAGVEWVLTAPLGTLSGQDSQLSA